MRRAFLIAIGLGLAAASPALADISYTGRAVVTAITGPCATIYATVALPGTEATLVYRPLITGVQAGTETLSLHNDMRAELLEPTTAGASLNGAGVYRAAKLSAGGNLVYYRGKYALTVSPITSTIMTLTGTLTNAWNVTGCTITFQSTLGLRPNINPASGLP